MNRIIDELSVYFKIWPEESTPGTDCDACVFEYTTGKCWDVVKRMMDMQKTHSLKMVCCYNAKWGIANSNIHCVVDETGVHWFQKDHEMIQFLKELQKI
jgi:hypothetical protein